MKVLIAYDDSAASRNAVSFAISLRACVEKYLVIYVVPLVQPETLSFADYTLPPTEASIEKIEKNAQEIIDSAKSLMQKSGAATEFRIIDPDGGSVADAIIRTAQDFNADLIVMGERRVRGIERIILGSVSSEVLRKSKVTVSVSPPVI